MSRIDFYNRAPRVTVLPDFRQRVERTADILDDLPKNEARVLAEAYLAWGTPDVAYADCRLIAQRITGQIDNPNKSPNDPPPQLLRVYEQIPASAEIAVGNADITIDTAGIKTVTESLLQFSSASPVFGVPGVTVCPAPNTDCILINDSRTDDGTLRRITRKFVNKGLLAKTIEFHLSPDLGATGITSTTLKFLTDPGVTTDPNDAIAPGGSVKISVDRQDVAQGRIWTSMYASGQGTIATETNYPHIDSGGNHLLVITKKTAINAAPSAPAPVISGTVLLIKADVRNGTRFEAGVVIYDYEWAEGNGVIASRITSRTDGLREVTFVSLGVRNAPTGIVVRDDYENGPGYTVYTVSSIQSAAGGTPTSGSISFQNYVPFTYPGRLKAYSQSISGIRTMLDVFKSPPVTTEVIGTISVTYTASNTISGLPFSLWQPTDAAVMRAQWIGLGNNPNSIVEAHPGYRAENSSATFTASAIAPNNLSIFNQVVYGGTTAYITLSGGPASPGGGNWVLHASIEPAFTDSGGTVYYRQTIVSAFIPSQPALPV